MNIVDYLISSIGLTISRNNAKTILLNRSISESTLAQNLTEQERDLLRADCLMLAATFPTSVNGSSKKSGDFEIRSGGFNLTNRNDLISAAMRLYNKWGDERYDESRLGVIKWEE